MIEDGSSELSMRLNNVEYESDKKITAASLGADRGNVLPFLITEFLLYCFKLNIYECILVLKQSI
jgi:hypothetical protein